jgi:dienelactone hydrolase
VIKAENPMPRCIPSAFRAAALLIVAGCASAIAGDPFPGTEPLTLEGDLADQLVAGVDRFLLARIAETPSIRSARWPSDGTDVQAIDAFLNARRDRLRKIIGAVDSRLPFDGPQLMATTEHTATLASGPSGDVLEIRWPVLPGVEGDGLLLLPPDGTPVLGHCVALPDADQTPEMLCGLAPGIASSSQFARRLAESGFRVIVPLLIDRADDLSVTGAGRATNQPHREFVYRPAFEMGRHVIGYEVQKVLALVDWLASTAVGGDPSIGVVGYGEGGLLALYAGALDPRIDVVATSGYFAPRENVWQEPIYRNVFALLEDFGDAELAALVAPRPLIIEACAVPQVDGPPPPRDGRSGAAPGRLTTPTLSAVRGEIERATALCRRLGRTPAIDLAASADGTGPFATDGFLDRFVRAVHAEARLASASEASLQVVRRVDAGERRRRQFSQLIEHTQLVMREGEYTRRAWWSKADRISRSVSAWEQSTGSYRDYFKNEVIGAFALPLLPPNVRSRQVFDEPAYVGYEVVMDVFPDVIAFGILLVPRDIAAGERRPVVVCQHGLEGRPRDVADPKVNNPAYNQYACRLAERGFITYSPQNLYIFQDRFRTLQRKANPLKKTLFSVIIPQHQQVVDWLAGLPMVDPHRIAFYGLSYGGKSAMRIPALVDRYCLSICSADFNEWIWKNASTRAPYSYVGTGEYEIFEFDLGNTFNYAEMAGLIAPRPFMVERGHRDGVAPDEWVAYEFAKVRLLYADLGIEDRARLEVFEGPHTIHGVGTFEFLEEHLRPSSP